jgi:nitronate monooxygenase
VIAEVFDFGALRRPIIVAPMAGGPSTPQLAAAGTNAGGLGFVAGGYLTADVLAERITATRVLTTGPIGVNLFVPQPSVAVRQEIEAYAAALSADAARQGATLGDPRYGDDDGWGAKLDVVFDIRPEVVSFTFGLPTADQCKRLRQLGIATVGTVTTLDEARRASDLVDAIAVQGPAAGGHRGTFDPAAKPATETLDQLLAAVLAVTEVPVVAAGGLTTAADVASVLESGAVAAQLGTALLLSDESGSSPVHRAALQSGDFDDTTVTRAFSGRYARGLRNRFVDDHEAHAPLGYPEVHWLTSPLRAASVRAGDANGTNVWAGTGFRQARTGSVATLMDLITP